MYEQCHSGDLGPAKQELKEGPQIYTGGGRHPPMGWRPPRKIYFPFIFPQGKYGFLESSIDFQFIASLKSENDED